MPNPDPSNTEVNPYAKVIEASKTENSPKEAGKSQEAAGKAEPEKVAVEQKAAEGEKQKAPEVEKSEAKPDENSPEALRKQIEELNRHYQNSAKENAEFTYAVTKNSVKDNPERLVELANSSNPKIVKMGERIAKELYEGMTLKEALAEIRAKRIENGEDEETKEEMEARIRNEIERKTKYEFTVSDYLKNHPVVDEKSPDYDKEVAEKFQSKFELLKAGQDVLPQEDLSELLNDAYYLATRGIETKAKKEDAVNAQKQIASAGAGAKGKNVDQKTENNPFAGLQKTL